MTEPLDPQDLQRAREGDPRAFSRVVRPYLASLRRFAHSFCGDSAEANDLAQESLIKAFRSIRGYQGGSSLSTWLYSIARSTFIDSRRGRRARIRSIEAPLESVEVVDDSGPEELLAARHEVESLRAALTRLDPKFRIPIILCEIEGLSYEHVAKIEQIPIGTVRSRISRGRAKLVALLNASMAANNVDSEGNSISDSFVERARSTVP